MSAALLEESGPGDRIRVLIARFLGVGFFAYLLVCAPGIAVGARILAWWWTPLALLLVFVPGIGLFFVTLVAPSLIPTTATLAALGIPLAAALWLVAWNGGTVVGIVRGSWLSAFAGLSGLCAALVWRPLVTLTIQFVAATSVATIDQLGMFGRQASVADIFYAAVWAFGITALFAGAIIMALRTGSILDASKELLERSAADAAAAQARERERSRFDGLIHDRVLTTLLATNRPDIDGRLAGDAKSAIDELDLAVQGSDRDGRVSTVRLARDLSAIVAEAGDDVTLSATVDDTAPDYPAAVAFALGGATAEALRNSVQHAGPDLAQAVVVELRRDTARVIVTDTGCGFDTAAVGPGRLGIQVSIVRRMASLEGGRSTVDSRVGVGTSVVLEWSRTS